MNIEKQNALRVLGLPETATPEEIRAAYDKLEDRYSEANYFGSPLWDMAAEKRELIRAAYAELSQEEPSAAQPAVIAPERPESSVSLRVRKLLNANDLDGAEQLLLCQAELESNPEYVYQRGMICWKRGWLDEATQYVEKASAMAPKNTEYRAACEKVRAGLPASAKLKQSLKRKETCGVCGACAGECACEMLCESICGLLG